MYMYMMCTKEVFEGTKHVSIGLDGTTLGGKEILLVAIFSCERGVVARMPPGPFRGATSMTSDAPGGRSTSGVCLVRMARIYTHSISHSTAVNSS